MNRVELFYGWLAALLVVEAFALGAFWLVLFRTWTTGSFYGRVDVGMPFEVTLIFPLLIASDVFYFRYVVKRLREVAYCPVRNI